MTTDAMRRLIDVLLEIGAPEGPTDDEMHGLIVHSGPHAHLVMSRIVVPVIKARPLGSYTHDIILKLEDVIGMDAKVHGGPYIATETGIYAFVMFFDDPTQGDKRGFGVALVAPKAVELDGIAREVEKRVPQLVEEIQDDEQEKFRVRALGILGDAFDPDRVVDDYRGRTHQGDDIERDFIASMQSYFSYAVDFIEDGDTIGAPDDEVSELLLFDSDDRSIVSKYLHDLMIEYMKVSGNPDAREMARFFTAKTHIPFTKKPKR